MFLLDLTKTNTFRDFTLLFLFVDKGKHKKA